MSFGIIIRGKNDSCKKKYSSKELGKYFGHIEDHEYRHFNRALGCEIKSKEHYFKTLEERGFVPQEVGNRLAEECNKNKVKKYDGISDKTMKVIGDLKTVSSKKGNIDLETSKRACESVGMKFNRDLSLLPAHYQDKGGFDDKQ